MDGRIVSLLELFAEVLTQLTNDHDRRIGRLERQMATQQELVGRLRTATDRLAAKIRELSEGNPGFEPIIAELEAMGTNPSDPVPDPDPNQPV